MAYWIYKNNSKRKPPKVLVSDWDDFFASPLACEWGSTEWTRELELASPGDFVLAYQTDRNELVGVAKVVRFRKRGKYWDIVLKPIEELRVKVRPLKNKTRAIARIPALRPGPVETLYRISNEDARDLLKAARATHEVDLGAAIQEAEDWASGGGFGTPEENRKVEQLAMRHVKAHYERGGWKVRNVSGERPSRGYDLECRQGRSVLHVEVKGNRGAEDRFIITRHEFEVWSKDKSFVLALVTNALSKPCLRKLEGREDLRLVQKKAIAFMCVVRPRQSHRIPAHWVSRKRLVNTV